MKFLLTIACIALFVATINGLAIPDDVKAKMMEMKKECFAEVPNIIMEHLEKFKKHEFVEGDEDLKKLIFCFNRKSNCQNEDGSYNVDTMKDNIAMVIGNHDHDKDVDECAKVDHNDALENAWAFAKCIKPRLPKMEME